MLKLEQVDSVIYLIGDLDISTAATLSSFIDNIDIESDIEINCKQLNFIDSAGLVILLRLMFIVSGRGYLLTISNDSDTLVDMLEQTGVLDVMENFKKEETTQ